MEAMEQVVEKMPVEVEVAQMSTMASEEKPAAGEVAQMSTTASEQKPAAGGVNARSSGLDSVGYLFAALLVAWAAVVAVQMRDGGNAQLWRVFASLAFFEGVSRLFEVLLRQNPKLLQGVTDYARADFLNTAVSLVHSVLISIAVVGLMLREAQVTGLDKMLSHDVLYSRPWPGAYTALATSCGYFAYDQLDMLRKRLYNPKAPSLLVHHAVLLTCFTPALQRNICINYLILTLICEVHSVFLHFRKVRKLGSTVKVSSSWGNFFTWVLNWIAFFSTRLTVHIYITVKLLWDVSKFPRGFEWPMALSGMIGLNILNVLLGQGLYKALRRERSSVQREHRD